MSIRAHAVTPIHFIEQEWSLWSRDVEEEIVPLCKELGDFVSTLHPMLCVNILYLPRHSNPGLLSIGSWVFNWCAEETRRSGSH